MTMIHPAIAGGDVVMVDHETTIGSVWGSGVNHQQFFLIQQDPASTH